MVTGYDLSRNWFDFCFENPDKINPNHSAIFFFAIEHCNRLGWKEKFGFPTQMTMDAIGIKKHQTYIKYFNELVEWGFFTLIQKSSNQYSANIISLSVALTKNGKALDKAFISHSLKKVEMPTECFAENGQTNGQSTGQSNAQSNSSINKQQTINKEEERPIEECLKIAIYDERWTRANKTSEQELLEFNGLLEKRGVYDKNPFDYKNHFANWKMSGKIDEMLNGKSPPQNTIREQKSKNILDSVN